MASYSEIAQSLTESLELTQPPVAVCLTESVPAGVEGGSPPAMGRLACAIMPQVGNTGRSALSLGCCGAGAYLVEAGGHPRIEESLLASRIAG
jgi:hypothetical protein